MLTLRQTGHARRKRGSIITWSSQAEQTAARANSACDELRQQKSALEVELSGAKSAIALEERLAKLDKAVFGSEVPSGPNAGAVED
jgi:hypothetical protein